MFLYDFVQYKPCPHGKKLHFQIRALVPEGKSICRKQSKMKRFGNLHSKIYHIQNLILADMKARKGKKTAYGIIAHDKKKGCNLITLQNALMEGSFRTSEYSTFMIYEPKEREIFRLPYFPDRICHHAIMNIMENIWVGSFTRDTYGCVKGKGIHGAVVEIKKALLDKEATQYCLKIDVKKFYPSVDHAILKTTIRKKIKDPALLSIMDNIIESAPGIPIGNYLSQYFGNLYLSDFDHWIKEQKSVKHYFRYVDDIIILSSAKEPLHLLLSEIKTYLIDNLKIEVKGNYQIFPVASRGIDFLGYVFYHSHVMLRKSIKKSFARAIKNNNQKSYASYYGWASHCNANHLLKKLNYHNLKPETNSNQKPQKTISHSNSDLIKRMIQHE